MALFAGVFRYVDQHFHTPETFLENTSELAVNADIRDRLFEGFRTEIISIAEGDGVLQGAEADLADDAGSTSADESDSTTEVRTDGSDPVTDQTIARDQAIELVLLDVFDTEQYTATFATALAGTQRDLIASADLESVALLRNKGEVYFDMRALYVPIYEGLRSNEITTEITQTEVPPGYGVFKVADRETTVNFLWSLLRNGPGWRGLTMAGAVLSLIGAVVIAERRPSTAIQFGGGVVGVAIVLIVIVYLIRFVVPILAGGGSSASPVVATYAANTWPLVRTMFRLMILGAVLAAGGGIAKLIWPDDWVYSSVSDERGVRSIRRRRGAPGSEDQPAQQPMQPAAMVPGYVGYAQPPYPGYPQPWGPYAQYPPGYPAPYPAGPYAQPAPQHYSGAGKPTVPVMPVKVDQDNGELVPPAPPPLDAEPGDLPADAVQIVPRVVATTDTTLDAASTGANERPAAKDTVVQSVPVREETHDGMDQADAGAADNDEPGAVDGDSDPAEADDAAEWADEKDW